jgi:hypothetical protein
MNDVKEIRKMAMMVGRDEQRDNDDEMMVEHPSTQTT